MSNTTILISSAKESFVRQKLSSREAKIHTTLSDIDTMPLSIKNQIKHDHQQP
jgi:hypothetical protein